MGSEGDDADRRRPLSRAAALTAGFTFAYLKEVGHSTLMHWASEGQKGTIGDALVQVIEQLKQEILATPSVRRRRPGRSRAHVA